MRCVPGLSVTVGHIGTSGRSTIVAVHGRLDPLHPPDFHPFYQVGKKPEDNIFVWSGHNYALETAKTLGILDAGGAVRVGPVHYNSVAEIDELVTSLGRILDAA